MSIIPNSYATCYGGPEDGLDVRIPGTSVPPRRIDFADQPGDRTARYVRVSNVFRRPAGRGHVGQVSYRFVGYLDAVVESNEW